MNRVLVIGESNPYGHNPAMALYHLPRGASGDRLRRILGMTDADYTDQLDKVNLVTGPWVNAWARKAAEVLLERDKHEVLILLGTKVRAAFRGPAPFTTERRPGGSCWVGLPHPSGLSRCWNDVETWYRARRVVGGVAPWLTIPVT